MIPLLIIILLVIWLITKVRRQAEYYKVEGLKLSWTNKANIEGNVTKWIFVLKSKTGNEIHRYENNDAENLKDWTAVSVDVIGKKEFDEKIIGDNTLDIYYNNVEEGKKLYTTTVNYSESDFSGSIDTTNLEEVQEVKPAFSYEFIMNKKNQTLGIHVEYIKLDGVLATKEQTTIHKPPNRNNKPDNMFSIGSGTENYAAWNADGHNVGDKIFTIESDKQIEKIDIAYTRPRYGPGWIIKENGVTKITETSNRGNGMTPRPVVYTYNIKDGTASSPSAGTTADTAESTSTRGIRYVWFGYENSGWSNRPLNISQIEVYSGGVNIVKGFGDDKVKVSSQYPAGWATPKKLFDGNTSTIAHTRDSKTNWWKIDLGKEYSAIDKVFVYNRHNCCWDRWAESFVKLLDKDGNEIARSEKLPSNKSQAKNYKEGGHRIKRFTTFDSSSATTSPSPPPPPPSTITQIPHQIPNSAPGGWCNHANSVHQDVPGCGRICSDINAVGRKDKGTWGSWDAYPGSVDCPAAKLDQVWKKEGNSRKLAIGNYSRSSDMTGGFKWYYYEGSYLSDPSSFNNKEYSNKGTGVTDFSNINKATNGALQVNGRDNYAVRWQGRFVPKKTGNHKFTTTSDDMSYLYVNNTKVVDNGGLHGMKEEAGVIHMTQGRDYLIEIFFSEKGGGDDIIVKFQEPYGQGITTNFSGYMIKDTGICSSKMFGGKEMVGDYRHCLECAHKWEPGQHKRAINCENIWLDD